MPPRTIVVAVALISATAAPAAAGYKFDDKAQLITKDKQDSKPALDTATIDLDLAMQMASTTMGADLLNAVHDVLLTRRNDTEFTEVEARALSTIGFALDQQPVKRVRPPRERGSYQLDDLPRSQWWHLFIDYKHWSKNDKPPVALLFDAESSPGYYASMMAAFDAALLQPYTLDADSYKRLHTMIITGVFNKPKKTENTFVRIKSEWNGDEGGNVGYGMACVTCGEDIDPNALVELKNAKVAVYDGEPSDFNGKHEELAKILSRGGVGNLSGYAVTYRFDGDSWVNVTTKFGAGDARGRVVGYLKRYFERDLHEIQESAADPKVKNAKRIEAICRLIRAIHTSHVFSDANGRLNTMLLLNRLLIDQGLSPSIVDNTSIFGGRATVATLRDKVIEGQDRFQTLVDAAYTQ